MDQDQDFNNYSQSYQEVLDKNFKITGFDAAYFAKVKGQQLKGLNSAVCNEPIRFLDYGCGVGSFSVNFKDNFPKASYVGVEPAEEMVKEAKVKYGEYGDFYVRESSEWKNQSYDLILSKGVFHYIPHDEHEKTLKELTSLLTVSGKINIWESNPFNPFTRIIFNTCPFDRGCVLIYPGKMKSLFRRVGLKSVQLKYTTFFPKFLSRLIPLEPYLEWFPLGGQYVTIGESSKGPNS